MGGKSRATRLLLAASLAVTAAVAAGGGQAVATPRIVGGERASIENHGYAVYLTTTDGFQYCGGTLVTAKKVVTAAHCAVDSNPADVLVVAGREDKKSDDGHVTRVRDIWVHPDYVSESDGADIAVLTLANQLPYDTIPPAGPADDELYQPGRVGLVLGWGRTAANGPPSRYLLKANVPLVSDADCHDSYPSAYDPASMVCAGYPEGGVDTCQGDSGGPLVVDNVLVGITSWGEGCAEPNRYGVYTRVAAYADDINGRI